MKQQIFDLIKKSGFILSKAETEKLVLLDYGLGDFQHRGLGYIDLLLTEMLRISILVLLPLQIVPEHLHPSYETSIGKEETLRVIYGEVKLNIEQQQIHLKLAEQFTIAPTLKHWFQAEFEGAVMLAFQNRVDEAKNIFSHTDTPT